MNSGLKRLRGSATLPHSLAAVAPAVRRQFSISALYPALWQPYIRAIQQEPPMPTIAEIIDNFSLLDDWDDRYRYSSSLGARSSPYPKPLARMPTRCRAAPVRSGSRRPPNPTAKRGQC